MFKNKIGILISATLLSSSLFAVENVNDFKLHSYGKQNVTVNFMPGFSSVEGKDRTIVDPMNSFGVEVYSKASLKQYHYKVGEFFWEGGGSFYYTKDKIGGDYEKLNLELDIGYSTNIKGFLLLGADIGLNGEWTTGNINYSVDTVSENELYFYGEVFTGLNFKSFSISPKYRVSAYSENSKINLKHKGSLCLQYNVDRNAAINFTPSVEYDDRTENSEYKATIGFSWLINQ